MKRIAGTLLVLSLPAWGQQARAPQVSETVKAVRARIEEMRKAKPASCSVGTRSSCTLENAAELPEKGVGYRIGSPGRKTNFGTDEMVFGLMELGASMADRFGEQGAFLLGDISAKGGGRLAPHINHQGGRDADIGFYLCDDAGRPQGNRMLRFDKEGKGEGTLRFDTARNWDFVSAMLESPYFQDLHNVLIADWLKKLMLDHARARLATLRDPREHQRQTGLLRRAEEKLRQPSSSPHDNHFHLALACTREDRKGG
jgi:penicillin-insensitive murein endopeptidase